MKLFQLLTFLVILFLYSCQNDTNKKNNCKNSCKNWQICKNNTCTTQEGYCKDTQNVIRGSTATKIPINVKKLPIVSPIATILGKNV